jgi:hypothetical protein
MLIVLAHISFQLDTIRHMQLHALRIRSLLRLSLFLLKHLLSHLFRQLVGLVPEERLARAVYSRGQPEQSVDKINPDGNLHHPRFASLVRFVIVSMQKDGCEDSKHNHPGDEEDQVPGKGAIGLDELELAAEVRDGTKGRECNEDNGRGCRRSSDNDSKEPFWREAVIVLVVCLNAVAVEAAGDDGKEKLQAAADEARHRLECLEPCLADRLALVGALVEGMTARLATKLLFVRSAELRGSAGKTLG